MKFLLIAVPALVSAGWAAAQNDPRDPRAKAPQVVHRSALEGYRPYAEQELRDWRRSNAEVREAQEKPAEKAAKPHRGHK